MQLHPQAQHSLGQLYHEGYKSDVVSKALKSVTNWEFGDSKVEAYKWLSLALTHGAGRRAGILRESVSICLTDQQRLDARRRAAPLFPRYPQCLSEEIAGQFFDWFLEECKSPAGRNLGEVFSDWQTQSGEIEKYRTHFCKAVLEELTSDFLGNRLAKAKVFFQAARATWWPNRSPERWGKHIAAVALVFPYDYLSDAFIQRRENTINRVWMNLVHR